MPFGIFLNRAEGELCRSRCPEAARSISLQEGLLQREYEMPFADDVKFPRRPRLAGNLLLVYVSREFAAHVKDPDPGSHLCLS
jgi:hypothetical protein